MDGGAWWATVHWVAKESDTTWQLKITTHTHTYTCIYTHMHVCEKERDIEKQSESLFKNIFQGQCTLA